MTESAERFERAIARFDEENAADPRMEVVDGRERPKELVYGERMSERLDAFAPDAPLPVRLAARCQHIRRWEIPREDYPAGKKGYHHWRTDLMKRHAEIAASILAEVGFDATTIEKVKTLLRKKNLKRDEDVQLLEDVICLVFLEHYFSDFAKKHDEEKLIPIVQKTWGKMSEKARAAALSLDLPEPENALVQKALAE